MGRVSDLQKCLFSDKLPCNSLFVKQKKIISVVRNIGNEHLYMKQMGELRDLVQEMTTSGVRHCRLTVRRLLGCYTAFWQVENILTSHFLLIFCLWGYLDSWCDKISSIWPMVFGYSLGKFRGLSLQRYLFSEVKVEYLFREEAKQWCGLTHNELERSVLTFILWPWSRGLYSFLFDSIWPRLHLWCLIFSPWNTLL